MILVFNAPPSTGKDFAADFMASYYGAHKLSFKKQLVDDMCGYYSINREQYEMLNHPVLKEEPLELFGGKSLREAMIHVSESVIKKEKGVAHYGKCVAREYMDHTQKHGKSLFVVSDGGVLNNGVCEEMLPLIRTVRYFQDTIIIVQIHRNGCVFGNDSRRYVGNRTNTMMNIAAGEINVQEESVDGGVGTLPVIQLHNNLGLKTFERVLTTMAQNLGFTKGVRK
jgi:hypothetical protein